MNELDKYYFFKKFRFDFYNFYIDFYCYKWLRNIKNPFSHKLFPHLPVCNFYLNCRQTAPCKLWLWPVFYPLIIIGRADRSITRNLTIYNIICLLGRWDKRLIDQASEVSNIFFFIFLIGFGHSKLFIFIFVISYKKNVMKGFLQDFMKK